MLRIKTTGIGGGIYLSSPLQEIQAIWTAFPSVAPEGELDEALVGDDVHAAALVHGAIEEFAQELAYVTGRFLKTKAWADTERIVVGGGFRQGRVGELAIARTGILLRAEEFDVLVSPFVSGVG